LYLEQMIKSLELTYSMLSIDTSVQDSKNKQIVIADLATKLLSKFRHQVSNDKDKLRILAQSSDWLYKNLGLLSTSQHSIEAFNLSDQNKSVLLLQSTKSEIAYRFGELPDSLVWRDKKLLKNRSTLQAKLLEKRSEQEKDSLTAELNHINQNIEAFVNMVKNQFPKYHKLKYQQVDVKAKEIQILLDNKTALLEYAISDSILHIFFVDKNQVKWIKKPIHSKTLNENIKNLHKVISDYSLLTKKEKESYKKYTELAFWFYQNLIEPAFEGNTNFKNLIIISDGKLGHLPFEVFLTQQAPQKLTAYHRLKYLVNDFNISYNYSATLWKENIEITPPKNNGQILGIAANYEIKIDSSLLDFRLPTDLWLRNKLKDLPAARQEVKALQSNFKGFFAFDKQASEKLIKEKAAKYAIIHLAMHGILENNRPVLSSLAFTEDSDSTESNFWQAHEISKMQLNANLVVLSACETGYGKFEKGNGIASLARAFMYAGAPSLIVSLWQVNDHATSLLMKNLYKNLADGMKKDKALRFAKLQYIKTAKGKMAHPAFWSPFIQIGNTERVKIYRKGNYWAWSIGALIVLLLAVGIIIRRRQDA
jgi:CHAT domain-containing protein